MESFLISTLHRNAEISALREATVYDLAIVADWEGGESYVFAATDFGHLMVYSLNSEGSISNGRESRKPLCALFKAPWDPIYSLHIMDKSGTKFLVW
jgi:hypothetical protein